MLLRSLLTAALLLWPACTPGAPKAGAADCGDFLAAVGHKPEGLEFLGCEKGANAQLAVLRARYRVRGTDAARVEEYLAFYSGMPRLRFACCGWENDRSGHGRLGKAEEYAENMHSEETLYSHREEWILVPWFYVIAEFFLEDP
ncbi:DUF4952 domain-containing protein [Deltaproteobacteria bacterium]|nr:DUF4952 domain-containing protein [Deltaproteobacteria bacterium]